MLFDLERFRPLQQYGVADNNRFRSTQGSGHKGVTMARRRGFFAELNYQAQQAEKRQRQQQVAAYRSTLAAQRNAERAQKAYERAHAAAARASAADKKAAEKEAARLHVESRLAEVESLNQTVASDLADIDSLLSFTLTIDDYVDLEALKAPPVEHPPFDPGALASPTPDVVMPEPVAEPHYVEPLPPKTLFGAQKKHAAAVAEVRSQHAVAHAEWQRHVAAVHDWYSKSTTHRDEVERDRLAKLAQARETYDQECKDREDEAAARNAELTKLINDLAFDVESAIQEYVGIVLANSVYPDSFPITHDYEFHLPTRELTLLVLVPEPKAVPAVKEYKYVRTKDEITTTTLPVREQRERYANAVWQVAVRTLHEVFEADRVGKIHSISLTVGVDTVNPATGQPGVVPLVTVAAERETFKSFDLTNVVPQATLEHMGAAQSKSPFDLTPADTGRGVRSRGQ
jgi:restriction system protein